MRICLHQIAKNTVYLSHFIRRGILLWSSCYCMGTILLLANFINYPTRKRCFLFFCDKTDNHGYSMQGKHLYLFVHNTKVLCIIFHFQFICWHCKGYPDLVNTSSRSLRTRNCSKL